MEFEEEGDKVRGFFRTWDVDTFKRVCVATLDRYSSDLHQKISALGRMVDALGPEVSVASISGGSTILVEAFCEYLGSGGSSLTTQFLIFGCLYGAYSGQLPVSSGGWTNSSSNG